MTDRTKWGSGSTWTEEDDRQLREWRAAGYSSGWISEHMPGRTRNSIIGRIHRLEMKADPAAHAAQEEKRRTRYAAKKQGRPMRRYVKRAPPGLPIVRASPVTTTPAPRRTPKLAMRPTLTLDARLHKGCRYPLWSDAPNIPFAEKRYCGGDGFPWCDYHRAIVSAPVRKR